MEPDWTSGGVGTFFRLYGTGRARLVPYGERLTMHPDLRFIVTLLSLLLGSFLLSIFIIANAEASHKNCNFPSAIIQKEKSFDFDAGKKQYTNRCAKCHGDRGDALKQDGANLVTSNLTFSMAYSIVVHGSEAIGRGKGMPAFFTPYVRDYQTHSAAYGFHNPKWIDNVVGYCMTLRK